jgi:hypothetical protein
VDLQLGCLVGVAVTRSLVGAIQSPLQRVDLALNLKFPVVFLCVWIH